MIGRKLDKNTWLIELLKLNNNTRNHITVSKYDD